MKDYPFLQFQFTEGEVYPDVTFEWPDKLKAAVSVMVCANFDTKLTRQGPVDLWLPETNMSEYLQAFEGAADMAAGICFQRRDVLIGFKDSPHLKP